MPTFLVTGGAGFIGGTFIRSALADSDTRLINLDKLTYAANRELLAEFAKSPNYTFVEGDIGDGLLIRRLLTNHSVDTIVNFAAESHVDRSITAPRNFVHTNVLGTCELLAAALDYYDSLPVSENRRADFRFLHVSTDEVYGSLGEEGHFSESSRYSPNSPYAASKAASDHFVRAYHHTYSLPVITTNCSNNYGPYQFPEKLIPLIVLNAVEGKSLPVYGQGQNVRDWLHVDDHIAALRMVLQRGRVGEVYNIGGRCELRNLDVVKAICDAVDELRPDLPHRPCERLIQFVDDRPGHDFRYAVDCSKIEQELGWHPRHTFTTGIRQTVAWYLDNGDWVRSVCAGRYERQRLGLRTAQSDTSQPHAGIGDNAIDGVEFRPLSRFADARGWLVEIFRSDELNASLHPAMAYVSETKSGVIRGPHEHAAQTDFFAFLGPGNFRLTLWDARPHSPTFGVKVACNVGESKPMAVIVPPGVVHAYQSISDRSGWVFNAPNRLYAGCGKAEPIDEIRHENDPDSPYQLD